MSRTRIFPRLLLVFIVALVAFAARQAPAVSAAPPTDLFISEYIEGSSNNKAIEIYNGTGAAVNLATGNYQILIYSNGAITIGTTISLTGTVADGDVYVVADDSSAAAILAQTDQQSTASFYNGNDAVVLRKGGATVVDSIGIIGINPGTEWGTGLTSTADNTLQRKDTICAGDTNTGDAFDPATEWNGFAVDTFTGLGSHIANCGGGDTAPSVTGTSPADGAINQAVDVPITVTFSEDVTINSAVAVVGSTSGTQNVTPTGGPTTFTLPHTDFANGETVTVTIDDAQVEDQDATDPPGDMDADYVFDFTIVSAVPLCDQSFTPIYQIQGSGATVAVTTEITTEGVVVGDYEGASPALRGFYMQDVTGDADAATSDGIFVFDSTNSDNVAVGDVVRVTGTPNENQGQSQIGFLNGPVVDCGTGTVSPVDVTLPFADATYAERYEGMLVRLPQTLYVTEHFQLGRFGQVVVSSGGRLQQPTNVVLPGAPAIALQASNNLNRIIVDDAQNSQNPDPILFGRGGNPLSAGNTLRGGDTAANIVGVMTYTWAGHSASGNAYRVRPVGALGGGVPNFVAVNLRPASAPAPTGSLRVGGMNVLNYFNTFDGLPDTVDNCALGVGGAAADCRGADTQAEFDRQWPKTVAALVGSGADIIGLGEIENDGYGPTSAIVTLTDQLNNATAPGTYAFIDVDTETGQVNALGTDAIKVGFIYKPGSVAPVGTTAALNTVAFVNGGDSAPRNRPALAQAFEEVGTGARFIVVANHLKSKGSACTAPDAGDGQGNCNTVRTNAVNQLITWLGTNPTATGDPDILIVGDLNSYAKEDPITTLESAGYINLIAQFGGANAYSYAFDGQWGYLDHALGNAAMQAQVTGTTEWHINADEPNVLDYNMDFKSPGQLVSLYNADEFRMSDHDLALVDLDLTPPPDTTPPTVTINQASGQADPTSASPINFTVVFNEPVTGFATGDVALSGTAGATTQLVTEVAPNNGTTYNVAVSGMANNGTVIATVPVSVADDAAGNDNTASTSTDNSVIYDATAPDTTITGNPPNPSNSSSATFTFTGDDGTGVGDVTFECRIDGGAWTACTSPQNYIGLSDGSHTFEVRAKDSLGNTDSTPAGYTWVIDTAGPTVTINQAGGQSDPTSSSPINFTVVFSEPVTGFDSSDVTLGGMAGATTAVVTDTGPMDDTTYNVAVSGMTNDGTVTAGIGANKAQDAAGNGNAASTSTDNTVTYVVPAEPTDIYVSTVTAGAVGAISFGSEDILLWDGSAWSVWFDGSDAGLEAKNAKHNINAFSIPEVGDEVLISFTQNARVVPGIPGKVDGMDIVLWDGDSFSLVFDGQDVGLTVLTHEKIDGLQELDPSLAPAAVQAAAGGSCQAYYLISTAGNGKVTNYTGAQMNISGEDVLGFCATQLGSTTAGKWHMLLDGSAEGVQPNAIVNISASDDGQTLYFTTKAAFNVGGATGGHSMVYAYDMTTGQFSGPHFSAPATGLTAKVDGLDVDGDLP